MKLESRQGTRGGRQFKVGGWCARRGQERASTWGKAWDVAVFGQIISQRLDSVTVRFQHQTDSNTTHLNRRRSAKS